MPPSALFRCERRWRNLVIVPWKRTRVLRSGASPRADSAVSPQCWTPPATAKTSSPKPPPRASSSALTSESPASSSACSSWSSATAEGQYVHAVENLGLSSVELTDTELTLSGPSDCRPQVDDVQDCPGHPSGGTQRGPGILFLLSGGVCAERRCQARDGGQRGHHREESGRQQRAGETFHSTRPAEHIHRELAEVSAGHGCICFD